MVLFVSHPSCVSADDSPRDAATAKADNEWTSIFDGTSLDGWHAVPHNTADDWSLQNGTIVGVGSQNRLSYLVWKEELADFELKLRYRLRTRGNTGVEIRGRTDTTGKRPYEGYHADLGHVGIGPHILGAWDFHFASRAEPGCQRGTSLVIEADDRQRRTKISDALTPDDVRKQDWNDVHIIARGPHCQLFINGHLASEFTDHAGRDKFARGVIGIQLHDKGMHVEFKDIRLKRRSETNRS